jgi:hypothetical protein
MKLDTFTASTMLLADSRSGRNGGVLPWTLLVAGSIASLAANFAWRGPKTVRSFAGPSIWRTAMRLARQWRMRPPAQPPLTSRPQRSWRPYWPAMALPDGSEPSLA